MEVRSGDEQAIGLLRAVLSSDMARFIETRCYRDGGLMISSSSREGQDSDTGVAGHVCCQDRVALEVPFNAEYFVYF